MIDAHQTVNAATRGIGFQSVVGTGQAGSPSPRLLDPEIPLSSPHSKFHAIHQPTSQTRRLPVPPAQVRAELFLVEGDSAASAVTRLRNEANSGRIADAGQTSERDQGDGE